MEKKTNPIELCYICTPYRGADELEVERNIVEARALAVKVVNDTGMFPVSPVLNSAFFHRYEGKELPGVGPMFWLDGDIVLLMRCDAIAVHGDMRWTKSAGCLNELKVAIDLARQGEMRIRVGDTWVGDLDGFEKVVDGAKGGTPFRSRTAPAFHCRPAKPYAPELSDNPLELPRSDEVFISPCRPYVPELSTDFLELPKDGNGLDFYKGGVPVDLCEAPGAVEAALLQVNPGRIVAPVGASLVKDRDPNDPWIERRALEIAFAAHAGQTDKVGRPYIYHPLAVASKFEGVLLRTVAILHDVVEDTDVTMDHIRREFPSLVVEAVDAITRREGESHDDYLARVGTNMTAREVKLADVNHNAGRIHLLADEMERLRPKTKYDHARAVLMGTGR